MCLVVSCLVGGAHSLSVEEGDPFDDVTKWQWSNQISNSLYGGTQNAFGSFYASQAKTPSFTCMAWSRTDRPGYSRIMGYQMHPIPGLPEIYITGHLDPFRYNSRPDGENTTISWKLVRYKTTDKDANFEVLTAGEFLVKNIGTEVPIILEGDNIIGSPPREKGIYVRGFTTGVCVQQHSHFNAISTPFQRCFNAVLTLF